ncbi:MAG: hypothetical protein GX434_13645 [Peptococcaceae bacterium]|nr:hypothetical protein [Peptococcaceae bacterium]
MQFEVVFHFFPSIRMKERRGIKIDHETIVRMALRGDQDAFRSLVEEYKSLVYVICLKAVLDPYEAENLIEQQADRH